MQPPSLVESDAPLYDLDLLRQWRGRRLSAQLQVLCVIGAHRFDELPLIDRIFPSLRRIYLFEPLAEPLAALRALAAGDDRLAVFPFAVSDRDGVASFHVASNAGESSSLLSFGSHRKLFPEVEVERTVDVPTRRLDAVIAEFGLEPPDVLLIDVQGAEYQVLRALSAQTLDRVRLIYTEVSTEAVYEAGGLLADVEALLAPRFVKVGYAPLREGVPMHGNAAFVARAELPDALRFTLAGRLRRGFHRLRSRLRAARGRAP